MNDLFIAAVGLGLLGSVVAGPAVAYGLECLPPHRRRTAEWLLIAGAVIFAVAADLLSEGPGAEGAAVYVIAALPGLIAFLASRSLLASTLVSLVPFYLVIAVLTRGRTTFAPELALDRWLPVQPAWMLVYGSLYVFVVILPLLVVRGQDLARRAMKAYVFVIVVAYAGFLVYPTAAPRPDDLIGDGFGAWCLRLVYELDPPYNCFPSLHVAYGFVSALACYRVHRGVGLAAVLWAVLIGVSTLYTKQHYVADVIAGALSAGAAYWWFLRGSPREGVAERDRRAAPYRALSAAGIFGIMIIGFWIAYRMQEGVS